VAAHREDAVVAPPEERVIERWRGD
jgi:hypothetical protein